MSKRNFRRIFIITISLIFLLLFYNLFFINSSSTIILTDNSHLVIDNGVKADSNVYSLVYQYKYGIYFYNMNEPIETWWSFECVDTKMRYTLNTKLCIHDVKYDQHVSGQLKQHGLWEPNNIRSFIKQMQEVPDANFIDIGANIGLYTLIAAKYNRSVISIEPLHDNLIRIHKAAYLENVQSKIIALVNAISNERKQVNIMLLDNNLGGSYVLNDMNNLVADTAVSSAGNDAESRLLMNNNFSLTRSSVIVNSIVLDDLVELINDKFRKKFSNQNGNKLKFILKIDIESYEPYAFENCTNLFKETSIVAIYLEFGKIVEKLSLFDKFNQQQYQKQQQQEQKQGEKFINESNKLYSNYLNKVLSMLNKFKSMNYEPYEVNGYNKLEFNQWRHWPWDVYLRQCDVLTCPGRPATVRGL